MDAVDSYIPTPVREVEKPFLMAVEDIFTITGRGTVATGRVERGKVKVGEEVEVGGLRPEARRAGGTGGGGGERGGAGARVTRGGALITPGALEEELRFAIREGGRTVGAGVVTGIVEEEKRRDPNGRRGGGGRE